MMEPRPGTGEPAFLTAQEAAVLLGVSYKHVLRSIDRGHMPGRKVGGRYSIPRRRFWEWWHAQERERNAKPGWR